MHFWHFSVFLSPVHTGNKVERIGNNVETS